MHTPSDTATLVGDRCRLLGLSERTALAYTQSLRSFERWAAMPAMDASQRQAAAWMCAMGGTRGALYARRQALGFLFRQLRGEEVDDRLLPRARRPEPQPVSVADPEEIGAVLAAIRDPWHGLFCRLVYATGLRLGEALEVRVEDVDVRGGWLTVRRAKGGGQRRVFLAGTLARMLAGPLSLRPAGSRLFPERLRLPDRIRDSLHAARRRAGVARRITVHGLRHAFATHLHERGIGLGELRLLLGHASIETTLRYVSQRERRLMDLCSVGDLLAALPQVEPGQQRIDFGR